METVSIMLCVKHCKCARTEVKKLCTFISINCKEFCKQSCRLFHYHFQYHSDLHLYINSVFLVYQRMDNLERISMIAYQFCKLSSAQFNKRIYMLTKFHSLIRPV